MYDLQSVSKIAKKQHGPPKSEPSNFGSYQNEPSAGNHLRTDNPRNLTYDMAADRATLITTKYCTNGTLAIQYMGIVALRVTPNYCPTSSWIPYWFVS